MSVGTLNICTRGHGWRWRLAHGWWSNPCSEWDHPERGSRGRRVGKDESWGIQHLKDGDRKTIDELWRGRGVRWIWKGWHHQTREVEGFAMESETIESESVANPAREGLKSSHWVCWCESHWHPRVQARVNIGEDWGVHGRWGSGGSTCVWGVAVHQYGFAIGLVGDELRANNHQANPTWGPWIGNHWRDLI